MYRYKINAVTFNDHSTAPLGDLTIIIGPNNVGKSRALRDAVSLITQSASSSDTQIIKSVSFDLPKNYQDLVASYPWVEPHVHNGSIELRGLAPSLMGSPGIGVSGSLESYIQNWTNSLSHGNTVFSQQSCQFLIAHLRTEDRLSLVRSGPSPSIQSGTTSILQSLYFGGSQATKDLSKVVLETFGVELVLDYSVLQSLQLRIGRNLEHIPADPRDAAPHMAKLLTLDDQGDGLRSFVGMVAALSAVDRPVTLIDEPEAFLHPPQAFAIGQYIARHSLKGMQVIVSTHSADVLRGMLSVTQQASVIRIDRKDSTNSFRQLPGERLENVATDPLLASARVFDGLFYAAAVVVEADADARFYQVISNRLRPNTDIHFVNADNKQTVPRITSLYKELGVRTAGIVDIDVLNNADEFGKQIESLNADYATCEKLKNLQKKLGDSIAPEPLVDQKERVGDSLTKAVEVFAGFPVGTVDQSFDSRAEGARILKRIEGLVRSAVDAGKPWTKVKECGVAHLDEDGQKMFWGISSLCAEHGLFINQHGELESMLTDVGLSYTSDKRSWIRSAIPIASSLEINPHKKVFAFIIAVHGHLFPQDQALKLVEEKAATSR